jgi:LEA14-like dessication related protein
MCVLNPEHFPKAVENFLLSIHMNNIKLLRFAINQFLRMATVAGIAD